MVEVHPSRRGLRLPPAPYRANLIPPHIPGPRGGATSSEPPPRPISRPRRHSCWNHPPTLSHFSGWAFSGGDFKSPNHKPNPYPHSALPPPRAAAPPPWDRGPRLRLQHQVLPNPTPPPALRSRLPAAPSRVIFFEPKRLDDGMIGLTQGSVLSTRLFASCPA